MAERIAKVGAVVINVTDIEKQKTFWGALLGVDVGTEFPGFCWFRPHHDGGVMVALQQSPDPGNQHGRIHIDTQVDDVDAARARVEELGGTFVGENEAAGFRWAIMADPEGNRFCIATGH